MSTFIDRRQNDRRKHLDNRERFLRRYRRHIRRAVTDLIDERPITDVIDQADVSIARRDIAEPTWRHANDGVRDLVLPGNREFMPGDRLARPAGRSGSDDGDEAGGEGHGSGGDGRANDDFTFTLTGDEFLSIFFDDLELPDLLRNEAGDLVEPRLERAGFASDGPQTSLAVLRTMRQALARRIALGAPLRRRLAELAERADADEPAPDEADEPSGSDPHEQERRALERRLRALPWLDEVDLRYRRLSAVPRPTSRAVMICLMDVSASMDRRRKDLAKRFYTLLHLFLSRRYERVELVFIRHTDQAEECDEQRFFHDRRTGGTTVLPALQLASTLIEKRYPADSWNVYLAQASDGDAFGSDPEFSRHWLVESLLPRLRYAAYIEVGGPERHRGSALARAYARIDVAHFQMARVARPRDIYPVFRRLFERRERQGAPS